nr:RNA-directed DNA polymerase, eukaryota [Tanacetum cinerariifolium]
MGRLRLHANVARFQRPPLNKAQHVKGANVGQKSFGVSSNSKVFFVSQSSYAGAVKNDGEHKQVVEMDYKASLVIDESCMLEYDYSSALKGKEDFGSLLNFVRRNYWRSSNLGVGSWFSSLEYASNSFVIDERAVWVDIEGVPMNIWTNNMFKKIDSKWGGLLFEEDRKNTSLYSKRICIKTKMEQNIFETFKIIIKEKVFWIRAKEVSGWIPDFLDEDEEDEEEDESDEDFEMVPDTIFSPIHEEPKHDNKSNFEKEDESSKATLKYPPGFTPDDVLRTKDVQVVDDVVEVQENIQKSNKQDNFTKDNNFRGVTHSKEEDKELFCSGQFRRSVGPQIDYFVAIQGEWIANAKKYLVISVYAPQEASEKRMLWSYLNHMIDRWDGESILIGDFNEVRHKEEHFGSIFNNHNAMVFNSFISSSGLTHLWVRDKKESVTTKKDQLKAMLKDIDILIDEKKVDQELLNKRMNVINSIHDLEKLEATEIAQKAKIKWSIEGDENSKKFHGNWIEDPNSVKNEFFSHFKERFDSPCSFRLMLEGEFLNKLSADQSIDLESNVTIEEIKRAVWDCGNFPKGGNSSFIALIPKMQDAKVVKDYRPISLIGSLYKIIAKILANRLVRVLGELVNEVQSAFIVNRQILDGPFILDELIHLCHAKKKETMIFKVDFKKAYD